MCKVDHQYLSNMQITNRAVNISEECKVMFVSLFRSDTAAIWYFTLVHNIRTPDTWQKFKQSLMVDFLLDEHVRRASDRLKKAKQMGNVSKIYIKIQKHYSSSTIYQWWGNIRPFYLQNKAKRGTRGYEEHSCYVWRSGKKCTQGK